MDTLFFFYFIWTYFGYIDYIFDEGEIAKPGYHKVKLTDYDITAELTSTMCVGFHCYTFPKSDASYILFDTGAFLAHGLQLIQRFGK